MSTGELGPPPDSAEREFVRLSQRTQIARMRRLVAAALAAYDLPPARLTLLAHRFNTTFHVDTDDGAVYRPVGETVPTDGTTVKLAGVFELNCWTCAATRGRQRVAGG